MINLAIMKYVPNCYLHVSFSKYCKFNNGRILKQLSIKVINKFIYFFFQINSACCNYHCSVHDFLRETHKLVDDKQSNTDKIQAFKKYRKDNIVLFSIIENFFSKKKFQQILDIKTIYQDGGEGQADS